jgi:hypothetical protein
VFVGVIGLDVGPEFLESLRWTGWALLGSPGPAAGIGAQQSSCTRILVPHAVANILVAACGPLIVLLTQ